MTRVLEVAATTIVVGGVALGVSMAYPRPWGLTSRRHSILKICSSAEVLACHGELTRQPTRSLTPDSILLPVRSWPHPLHQRSETERRKMTPAQRKRHSSTIQQRRSPSPTLQPPCKDRCRTEQQTPSRWSKHQSSRMHGRV